MKVAGTGAERQSTPPQIAYDNEAARWHVFLLDARRKEGQDSATTMTSPYQTSPERDWTEDFPHENGNYNTHCRICNEFFTGHKRRVICKLCSERSAREFMELPEEDRQNFLRKFI